LRADFRPCESDVDLLVELGPIDITKKLHAYLDARETFKGVFQANVDLVMQGAAKNKVIAKVIKHAKRLIYSPECISVYLLDILEACAAIEAVMEGVSMAEYRARRSVRSSAKSEFILIGEASEGLA
jgi:predicted nucleotidyltransferase